MAIAGGAKQMSERFDVEFDIVVVGSGAAGMTTAITAAYDGLKPLIIEKEPLWGGSTALSGGGIWIPNNRLQKAAGIQDTYEDAEKFLEEAVTDEGLPTSREKRSAYLRNGPDMIDMLIDHGVKWAADVNHSDYMSDLPHAKHGRSLDSEFIDAKNLGPWLKTMRRSPAPYAVRLRDLPVIGRGTSSLASIAHMAYIYFRDKFVRLTGGEPVGVGQSLAAQLMMVAQKLQVPVWLETPLVKIIFENRRAVGIVAMREGKEVRIGARHGVMLGAGGFAHEKAFRTRHQGKDGSHSEAAPGDTGDAIKLADEIGAMTAMMGEGWWGPSTYYPDPNGGPGIPVFCQWERSLPHSIVVNQDAQRFSDESEDYYQFASAMLREKSEPTWLIIDSRHRNKYTFGGMFPGRTPQGLIDAGFFKVADTIEGIAEKCGLDAAALKATVDRFNQMARSGKDTDFKRGDEPYDRMWGDPAHHPNPNLGTLEKAPFYATALYVGDIGTKGGLVTNPDSQVLDTNAVPIEGLYAAGNTTASLTGRAYPGPGVTLGPAMTFGYLAAKHIARRITNA